MDGEQAWTENKRGFKKNDYERSARQAVWLEQHGLEQSVDSNKAWTRTKRGLEQSVDLKHIFFGRDHGGWPDGP